jgi:membrane-bound metal-dependent hydrolase YbcI (DUF457 family)
MFIGHFGVGLGAKKAAPRVSLGTLFIAAQFLDLLWPTFLLLGIERVAINPPGTSTVPLNFVYYPWTHSLLMAMVWGVVVGGIYFAIRKNGRAAIVLFFGVVSHWVLDLFVHHPDLPLVPGGKTFVGWSLWDHPGLELPIELAIFVIGLVLYLRTTSAKDAIGKFGPWLIALLLVAIQMGNEFGPPPASVTAIAWFAELQWLFVAFAYWVDRHRIVRHLDSEE